MMSYAVVPPETGTDAQYGFRSEGLLELNVTDAPGVGVGNVAVAVNGSPPVPPVRYCRNTDDPQHAVTINIRAMIDTRERWVGG